MTERESEIALTDSVPNTRTAFPRLPPIEYLLSCSRQSLQDLEMPALNRSNNCLRAAKDEWHEAVAQSEIAGVARWLIEHREELLERASRTLEIHAKPQFPESVEVTGPKIGLEKLLGPKRKS
jgi:hypothetical protein